MQPTLSPDGNYWWDGMGWVPVATTPLAAPARSSSGISWAEIGGGITVVVSAVVLGIACYLPFTYYVNPPAGDATQASIFDEGYTTGFWYAVEPALVIVLAVTGGTWLTYWRSRTMRALVPAALGAMGLQTFALFMGYAGATNIPGGETAGPAGWVGMAGGLLMMIGAIVAGLGAYHRRSSS